MYNSYLSPSATSSDGLMASLSKSQSILDVAKAHRPTARSLLRAAIVCVIMALIMIGLSSISPLNSPQSEMLSPKKSKKESMAEYEDRALRHYASSRLARILPVKDFLEFSYRLRFYGELFDAYELKSLDDDKEYTEMLLRWQMQKDALTSKNHTLDHNAAEAHILYPKSQILWHMEIELFPWAHFKFPSLLALKRSFKGKGIVIPTGSHHLRFAIHLVQHIRHLKCHLPITVAYSGDKDLKSTELNVLHQMKVDTMDVAKIFDTTSLGLEGWEIKPFALLAAPYEQVILADADIVFLQDPTLLLQDPGYFQHGAIIFHDRTLFAGDKEKTRWLDANLPHPLGRQMRESRMYQRKSAHEQESGVVVWNKRLRFLGLLAACKMNSKAERDLVTYKTFYGDKESFWIGLEMAQQSWTELQAVPGVIGNSHFDKEKDQLVACGRILQFDRGGWPLWFNGAIVEDKRDTERSNVIMNFTHFAREGVWDFGESCLDHDVTVINATLKNTLDDIISLWRPRVDFNASSVNFL